MAGAVRSTDGYTDVTLGPGWGWDSVDKVTWAKFGAGPLATGCSVLRNFKTGESLEGAGCQGGGFLLLGAFLVSPFHQTFISLFSRAKITLASKAQTGWRGLTASGLTQCPPAAAGAG